MIGFAGLSHLGLVSSVVAAAKGFEVIAYDPDEKRCAGLARGKVAVEEPGLAELLAKSRPRLRFTSNLDELQKCSLINVALDVRSDEHERSNLAELRGLLESVLTAAPRHSTLVLMSQAPPSATRRWLERIKQAPRPYDSLAIYYQVETLAQGQAVERAQQRERFLIGCDDPRRDLPAALALYLEEFDCPIFKMSCDSPELAKQAINLYLDSSTATENAA